MTASLTLRRLDQEQLHFFTYRNVAIRLQGWNL